MRILTLDIGGTMIKSGIFEDNQISGFKESPTLAQKGGMFVLKNAKEIISTYSGFDAVGISTAGQINPITGTVIYANSNIPEYTGICLKKEIEKAFNKPTWVENDVNSAALGELNFSGRNEMLETTVLFLTYGTGVGGSAAINGKLLRGVRFSAGEFGMMCFRDKNGELYYYENFASTTALVKKASSLDSNLDSGRKIFENLDNPAVMEILNSWIDDIVMGLVSLTHIFNPSHIVVGGGVMSQTIIIGEINSRLEKIIMPSFAGVKVLPTKLGNMAGLYGAAYIVLEKSER